MIDLDIRKRRRKVYYDHYDHNRESHPVIRVGGKYLVRFGFNVGDTIDVEVEHERIVIKKADQH